MELDFQEEKNLNHPIDQLIKHKKKYFVYWSPLEKK
jgi:hypothetical protein